MEEEPTSEFLLDRHLAHLTATLKQIFGVRVTKEDLYLTQRLPPQTEEENALQMLNWMGSVKDGDNTHKA